MAPLKGIRVIELGVMIAVPAATHLLASWGAEVIKVEDTQAGDQLRFFGSSKGGASGWFANANAGKRSIAIDLKSDAGREALWRLIDRADVLVEGFRAGVMERLGFGYAAVSARRPAIVYCSSSGFGDHGPYADRPVYDPLIQALSGWAGGQRVDDRPTLVRAMAADKVGAWHNAQAVLAALVGSARGGGGCHIRNDMLDANLAFVWPDVMMHCTLMDDDVAERPNLLQAYRLLRCADGWVSVAVGTDAQWRAMCLALDEPGLAGDDRFATAAGRGANTVAWWDTMDAMTDPLAVAEVERRLLAADVPVAPVRDPAEVFDDPHVRANGLIRETLHPHLGRVRGPRPRSAVMDVEVELSPAPLWGEHTAELLPELGFDQAGINAMLASGAARG